MPNNTPMSPLSVLVVYGELARIRRSADPVPR